ncbi:hypothetical protein Desor_2829 [Desulfosporosinus orientis DSM 765]|uniref:DUF4023 domain-containing protein n=1 Tax=Desulfosporosinus orientis (strain ATCC 19365 / DSM 765 / NCIMB 8382 / VKM B-1628 / Singapore I) TaxID=768706 RepID=G7WDN8_DESOD|nr:DUF4023 family protein [Desulfosporosinus orientis]AET68363.1 hypothetical protein Desor_2829 [Desulfosporosinus orientis DSM 765]
MDNLDKILDSQEKTKRNNQHQGHGNPGKRLPNKQHSTNK